MDRFAAHRSSSRATERIATPRPLVVLPVIGLAVGCLALAFAEITDKGIDQILGALIAFKGAAYALSLGSFRGIRLEGQVSFVSADQVRSAAEQAGVDEPTADALVSSYQEAQLTGLKTALLFAGFVTVAAFAGTRKLPSERFDRLAASVAEAPRAAELA